MIRIISSKKISEKTIQKYKIKYITDKDVYEYINVYVCEKNGKLCIDSMDGYLPLEYHKDIINYIKKKTYLNW